MAGFKGFGFTSPEEIIAQTQQGFQQALTSGNVHQMRAAVMQQAAFAIGGSPELRKARQTEKVLKTAFKSAPKTGDEVLDQIAFYKEAQRAAVEADLPEIALQATEYLSTLRLTEEERGRLKSRETREEAEEGRRAAAEGREVAAEERRVAAQEKEDKLFALDYGQFAGRVVLVGPDNEYIDTVDMTTREGLNTVKDLTKEGKKFNFISEETYFEAGEAARRAKEAASVKKSALPITTINKFNEFSRGQDGFIVATDQLVDIIDEGPLALTATGRAGAIFNKLGSEGRALVNLNQSEEEQNEEISKAARTLNISVSRLNSSIIGLAYALASSRESGKLSESDVLLAAQTLGVEGQPDPAAALTVLRDIINARAGTWDMVPDSVIGFQDDDGAMEVWQSKHNRYSALQMKIDDAIDKWSKQRQEPPPAAVTPLDDLFGGDTDSSDTEDDITKLYYKRSQ